MIDAVREPPDHPSVAAVTDALGRVLHHQANVLDLISPTPGRVLFGVAVTIRFLPYREDLFEEAANSFARCFYAAIGNEPHGKVVVFDSSGYVSTSVGGGTKLSRLHNTGVAGLITMRGCATFVNWPSMIRYTIAPARPCAQARRTSCPLL